MHRQTQTIRKGVIHKDQGAEQKNIPIIAGFIKKNKIYISEKREKLRLLKRHIARYLQVGVGQEIGMADYRGVEVKGEGREDHWG